jgi:ABC-type nitrate/sulfonate/bicarbonate transport system substrate-binding protein
MKLVWALAIAFVCVCLGGCGGTTEGTEVAETHSETSRDRSAPAKLRVTLDGLESPQNVGILVAAERGYFKDLGLDVWTGSPFEQNRPVNYVAKGTDDFGLTQQPQVAIALEKGMPITAIGSVIPHPTDALIWLKKSEIHGIGDLKGKTIAVPGIPYQERILRTLLARAGLAPGDVKIERVSYYLLSPLLRGQADAIFTASWNLVGVELESLGAEPVITRVQDLGVPDYEGLQVIAPTDLIAEDPELVRDFMTAVAKGTAAAVGHPAVAVKAIRASSWGDSASNRKALEAQVRATLPLLSTSSYMSPERAQGLVDWMSEEGLLERKLATTELLTNAYR